jgi:hypothetical protein
MTPRHSRFDANHGGRREKSARPTLSLPPPQRVPHWSNLDRPFCKYLAQQVVRQYLRWWLASERVSGQPRNFPKFRQVVGVSMANFGHKTPPTPRKGIIDRLRRKSASDWCVTLSLLDQNWAYFSILKFQDHIFWDGGSSNFQYFTSKLESTVSVDDSRVLKLLNLTTVRWLTNHFIFLQLILAIPLAKS